MVTTTRSERVPVHRDTVSSVHARTSFSLRPPSPAMNISEEKFMFSFPDCRSLASIQRFVK
jgi:hypothetical protein